MSKTASLFLTFMLIICTLGTARAYDSLSIDNGAFTGKRSGGGMEGRNEFLASWGTATSFSEQGEQISGGLPWTGIWMLQLGKYVSPNTEVLVGANWQSMDYPTIMGPRAYEFWWSVPVSVSYNFISDKPGSVVPYIGGGINYTGNSINWQGRTTIHDALGLQGFAGIKFYLGGDCTRSRGAIYTEYRMYNQVSDFKSMGVLSAGVLSVY